MLLLNLNSDLLIRIFRCYINRSNFNPILKLVNYRFNFLYSSIYQIERKHWSKYELYCSFFDKVSSGWKLFIANWNKNCNDKKTYNYDRLLNNYCQIYLLKHMIHTHTELLLDYYQGYPNTVSKYRKKMIEKIYSTINLELKNNDYSNYILITPELGNDIFVEEDNKNVFNYYTFILGPPQSIYQDGLYIIKLEIYNDIFKKPTVKFLTTIYHPNIDIETGLLDIDILNESWNPSYGGYPDSLVVLIQSLLSEPELSNFNPNIHHSLLTKYKIINEYKSNKYTFTKNVKKYVDSYASYNLNQLINCLYSL